VSITRSGDEGDGEGTRDPPLGTMRRLTAVHAADAVNRVLMVVARRCHQRRLSGEQSGLSLDSNGSMSASA
jgi:hypothetical protein